MISDDSGNFKIQAFNNNKVGIQLMFLCYRLVPKGNKGVTKRVTFVENLITRLAQFIVSTVSNLQSRSNLNIMLKSYL